jgi:hypothetical protein
MLYGTYRTVLYKEARARESIGLSVVKMGMGEHWRQRGG